MITDDNEDYGIEMDNELIGQDFDDIDLFGEIMEEELPDSDIIFE